MKKKLLLLLVPMMAMVMTGCVKYNGQGKNGPKSSSAAPDSQQSDSSSEEPASSSADTSSSEPAPSSSSASSNPSSSSSEVNPPTPVDGEDVPAGTQVKVYLVFGEYGKYKGNSVNTGIDSLFLEHAMEYDAKVGDDLPGKADVTSSVTGSEFVAWTSYNNDGKLTEYSKVPASYDKILYASFSGGNGQGGGGQGGGGGSVTPEPDPGPQERVTVTLNVTYETAMGEGVYLVGDFCDWTPASNLSLKFEWSAGNVWTKTIEVNKDTVYHCKLVIAPYDLPSQVYKWEKEGEGNERTITFSSSTTLNLEWGNY